MTPRQEAEHYGIDIRTVYKRRQRGIPVGKPLQKRGPKRYPFNVKQLARDLGVPYATLRERLARGEPPPERPVDPFPAVFNAWRTDSHAQLIARI